MMRMLSEFGGDNIFFCVFRFAYPVYLLEKLKETIGDQQLMLFYDIACSFEAHLKVHTYMVFDVYAVINIPI